MNGPSSPPDHELRPVLVTGGSVANPAIAREEVRV